MNTLIERYIYAVTKRLPENQRKEIEIELRSLIDDMIMSKSDEPNEAIIKEALLELGDPAELADQYRDKKRYLIGPDYIDQYFFVLKIVLSATGLVFILSLVVGSIFSSSAANILGETVSNMISGLIQAGFWVTVFFALAEYYNWEDVKSKKGADWTLKDLPTIPNEKSKIKISDSIIEIFISTVATIVILFTPHIIGGSFEFNGDRRWLTIFNLTALKKHSYLFIGVYIATILKEGMKLVMRRWSIRLALFVSFFSLLSATLSVLFFSRKDIWNSELLDFLPDEFVSQLPDWLQIIPLIVGIIVIVTVIEIIIALYKGYKYEPTK